MPDTREWLEKLGLGQYADAFAANNVTLEHLPDLSHELLKELGVVAVGDRMTMLKAATAEPKTEADISDEPPSPDRSAEEARPATPDAERRQITVMFCDLVGSTALSEKLDPEDLREVMTAYQKAAGAVIERYEGHVAQYLGDGLMTYFGWPKAHEDDAQRAVRAGLDIVTAVQDIEAPVALSVRVGISTGPVAIPTRTDSSSGASILLTDSTISRPARTARWASSSCALGQPK